MINNEKKSRNKIPNNQLDTKENVSDDSLLGKCLVFIGNNPNSYYKNTVVYINECNSQTVKGIIINKLLFGSANLEYTKIKTPKSKEIRNIYEELYQGGPENPAHGFVLFPKDGYISNDPYSKIQGDVAISTSFGILQEILDGLGPDKKIIAMGHCCWNRGELEWEIFNNEWLIVPSDIDLMFDTNFEEKWQKARQLSGIKFSGFIQQGGIA